jgi:hypothetical protein
MAAAIVEATVSAVGLVPSANPAGRSAPSALVPIVPCRLVDTRAGGTNVSHRSTPIGGTESATLVVRGANGNCSIPSSASAIVANTTAVDPRTHSYITIFPSDATTRPTTSNLNVFARSSPIANQVTVGLSAGGTISVYNNSGTVDITVDIIGYYQPAANGTLGPAGPSGIAGSSGLPSSVLQVVAADGSVVGPVAALPNSGIGFSLDPSIGFWGLWWRGERVWVGGVGADGGLVALWGLWWGVVR